MEPPRVGERGVDKRMYIYIYICMYVCIYVCSKIRAKRTTRCMHVAEGATLG